MSVREGKAGRLLDALVVFVAEVMLNELLTGLELASLDVRLDSPSVRLNALDV